MLCQYRIPVLSFGESLESHRPLIGIPWGPYQGEVFDFVFLEENLRLLYKSHGFSLMLCRASIRAWMSYVRPVASYSPLAALLTPHPLVLFLPDVFEAERAVDLLLSKLICPLPTLVLDWGESLFKNLLCVDPAVPLHLETTPLDQELQNLFRYHSWSNQ